MFHKSLSFEWHLLLDLQLSLFLCVSVIHSTYHAHHYHFGLITLVCRINRFIVAKFLSRGSWGKYASQWQNSRKNKEKHNNEKFHDLYFSQDTIRSKNSRIMRWANTSHAWGEISAGFWWGNLKDEYRCLEDPGLHKKENLFCIRFEGAEGKRVWIHLFLNSALDRGQWLAPSSSRFNPGATAFVILWIEELFSLDLVLNFCRFVDDIIKNKLCSTELEIVVIL